VTGPRLVLDIQTTQTPLYAERGIPRYTTDLSRALLKVGAPIAALALNPSRPWPRRLHAELARSPLLAWNTSGLFHRLSSSGPVAYHIMSPLEGPRPVQSTLPIYVFRHGLPIVCTIYDLIPEIFDVFPKGTAYGRLYRLRRDLLRHADLLLAISRSTREDAIEHLAVDPGRVVDIGTGASEFFRPRAEGDNPERLLAEYVPGIERPFVHAVTGVFGLDKRKNTEVLIDAYARLPGPVRRAHQLVVTCRITDEDRAVWTARGAGLGLRPDDMVLTGFVPDAVLRALYQRASLFVYPSRYEGFGLPPLEAARCGCAAITSNTSAMPEILGWEPATFDPDDPDALATLIDRALSDDAFRAQLLHVAARAAGQHTWERVAARTVEAYGRLDQPRARRRRPPLRLAMVGPLPPARSGVAAFNHALARHLAERCELDYLVEPAGGGAGPHDWEAQGPDTRRRGEDSFSIFSAESFGRVLSPAGYDAVFYSFAAGSSHAKAYELALGYPGIVWLHDLQLAPMYLGYAHRRLHEGDVRQFMLNTLGQHYADRVPLYLDDDDLWSSPDAYEEAGARLASELARRSRGVIVGSETARSVLALDVGPYTRLPPTWVVPPAASVDDADGHGLSGDTATSLVLAVGRASRDEVLLEAAALVAPEVPLRLALVGEIDDHDERRLRRRAEQLGLGDRLDLTGWLPRPEYRARLERATAAVHLRSDTSGAASFALVDFLSRGLPTVSSASVAAELPTDAVQAVAPDITVNELAGELRRLLADKEHRRRLSNGALAHASSWTLDDVAEAVLEIARQDSVSGHD